MNLNTARRLVAELEAGNHGEAELLFERMARERDQSLFTEIGKLTRELHDALASVRMDSKLAGLAEVDFPDAKARLNYVVAKTSEAAHRTLSAVESATPLSDRLGTDATRLLEQWTRFTRREMSLEEFRDLSEELSGFLGFAQEASDTLRRELSEVLMAQDFQDLTGQVISRVIDLVQQVETSLVDLIRCSSHSALQEQRPQLQVVGAEGPAVRPGSDPARLSGQDEVDDLLSSLGF